MKAETNDDGNLAGVVETVLRGTLDQDVKRQEHLSRTRFLLHLLFTFNLVTLTCYRYKLYDVLMFGNKKTNKQNLEPFPTDFHQLEFSKYKLTFRSYGVVKAVLAKSEKGTHRAMLTPGRASFVSSAEESNPIGSHGTR